MQSYDKSRLLISLLLLIIVTFAFVILLTNIAFAQILHNMTLYEMVNRPLDSAITSKIEVGNYPQSIAERGEGDKIYVANTGSDSVSVISAENNKKIGEDIPVGEIPIAIAVNYNTDTIYVVNAGSDSVSVISGDNNTKIGEDIPVGENPTDIISDYDKNKIYVTNSKSNTVSVISAENNKKIEDIPVGENPTAIAISDDPGGGSSGPSTIYVANTGSDSVSVISPENNKKIGEDIPVGERPTAIAIDNYATPKIYVANSFEFSHTIDGSTDNGTVSVISGDNNTKIGEDIPVGENPTAIAAVNNPTAIAVGDYRATIYVVNAGSDSVSIISGKNNTKIGEDIPVGRDPRDIHFSNRDKIYVVNAGSDSVSVISPENNTKIGEDIPVGEGPTAIAISDYTGTIYVANTYSHDISVIDGITNKVVAGVTFEVYPFYSGFIECDGLISPVLQYFYVWSGANCIAKPNKGFEFLNWEEKLRNNSTQIINFSRPGSILESIKDFFYIKSEEPEAQLKITKFVTFTANFKELPPPVPSEYWIPLYGLIPGFFIPSIIKWLNGKRQRRNLREYLNKIGKVDRYIIEDDALKLYSNGKISDSHYQILKDKISQYYGNTNVDK